MGYNFGVFGFQGDVLCERRRMAQPAGEQGTLRVDSLFARRLAYLILIAE